MINGNRAWSVADIVQIKRIVGTAVLGSTKVAAYILQEPQLVDDRDHYELFTVSSGHRSRLLAQAAFMANLEWRPGTRSWTVRADFGDGAQLYQISEAGAVKPLLVIKPLVLVGGYDGLVIGNAERPELTGVLSYQWAPDGRHYWYSRVRLHSAAEQERRRHGIVYDDTDMFGAEAADLGRAIEYAGTELHVVDVLTGRDRLAGFEDNAMWNERYFSFRMASAGWVDSSVLQYDVTSDSNGALTDTVTRVKVDAGVGEHVGVPNGVTMWTSMPTLRGFIVTREARDGAHIYEITPEGDTVRDFGLTRNRYVNPIPQGDQRGGMWRRADGASWIFATSSSNWVAHGLVFSPSTRATDHIERVQDTLNECSFDSRLDWGVCNRESLVKAPELVSINPVTGRIKVLAEPNARYGEVASLHTVAQRWRNRFGYVNTGYVTFPRDYISGHRYPVLLVTHGVDAANLFAWGGFQWQFPIQVFAEEGYFVLSVNEARRGLNAAPYMKGAHKLSTSALWFANSINPMASLEAAVEALIASGRANAQEIGIAGYSYGAETTSFVVSHSHVFRAASIGDDAWWDAGGYWGGEAVDRYAYDSLFGGPPFDPRAEANYLKYSPSARTTQITCAILQEFSGHQAHEALELNELLLHAQIPTELVVYPAEAHIFYRPRDRAMAMQRNLEWFNYWLRGKRDGNPVDPGEYQRWDKMALRWAVCKAECKKALGLAAR